MLRFGATLMIVALFLGHQLQAAGKEIAAHLQIISVTVKAGGSEGSGVAYVRDQTCLIWTAGHVVAGLKMVRRVPDPTTGSMRSVVTFRDAQVVKTLVEDGRTVGHLMIDAEVLKYSSADYGDDLAILRVRKKGFITKSVVFEGDALPPVGTPLLHVGSLLGQVGSNSLTGGICSAHGRLLAKKIYDQTDATSFPGSSGGGIYRAASGQYVGMLVRGAGEGFSLYVPVRRMRTWATRVGVSWAIDPKVKLPTEAELQKLSIGDPPGGASGGKTDMKRYPFRIHTRPEVKDEKAGS
jgi:S1-C subfamily serine protease